MNKINIYIKSILIPVLIGGIVGFITAPAMDYIELQRPPFSPPAIAFPIVWTILYVLMGISYGILKSNGKTNQEIDRIYYLQLAVNALWSIFFFTLEWRLFAFFWLVLLAILIISMIRKFYAQNKISGLLQIPYLAWVIFAGYLNFGTYWLNR